MRSILILVRTALLVTLALPAVGRGQDSPAPPVTVTNEESAAPVASELAAATTTDLMERAQRRYRALDFDQVVPLVEEVLSREGVDIEIRLDAYQLHGSALAVVGDTVEAEKPFRFLLRGRPDFDLPAETPPKILAVFRKVQVEERAVVDQLRALERKRIISSLELSGEVDEEADGGQPLPFVFKLKDPRGAVSAVRLDYRRRGEPQYLSLPLQPDGNGGWSAEVPGEWTASADDYVLEYHVTTLDASGAPLLGEASADAPLSMAVTAGSVSDYGPFYTSVWFWGATAAVLVAAGGTAAGLAYALSQPPASDLPPVVVP